MRKKLLFLTALIAYMLPGCSSEPFDYGDPETATSLFIAGAELRGANGMGFDADGRLYVAVGFGSEIVIMDPESGEILERFGEESKVTDPDGLTIGPDGAVYWTNTQSGTVGRRTPDGQVATQFVGAGVNPITFSDDGRLFVALTFQGDDLYELDPELRRRPRLIIKSPGGLNGFDFGPDGHLYSPHQESSGVVRINVNTGEMETVVTGFKSHAVKFDSRGRLYTIQDDSKALVGRVVRFNLDNNTEEILTASLEYSLDNLALDASDRLYVSNFSNGAVTEVLEDGTLREISRSGLILPGGLAVVTGPGGSASLFIADLWSLHEYDALTGEHLQVAHFTGESDALVIPMNMAADGEKLLVSSWFSGAVQRWEPQEQIVLETIEPLIMPFAVTRFRGDLVVASLGKVIRDSASGQTTLASMANLFFIPGGLAATADALWVTEKQTGVLLQLIADGENLKQPAVIVRGLLRPEGIAVSENGTLLVLEAGADRLLRIDPETRAISTVASDLGLSVGESVEIMPRAVAVGPGSRIYISTTIKGNVLIIE